MRHHPQTPAAPHPSAAPAGRAGAPPAAALSEYDLAAARAFASGDAALVMARDWNALAAEYAPDAVRMPPNQPPVQGRAAIRAWLDGLPPVTSFTFRLDDVQGDGSVAYLRGTYTITVAPPGTDPVSDTGKELVVLRRQADGSWLRQVDAWSSNVAPAR
jgi:ketosteroid isomerase-like protein